MHCCRVYSKNAPIRKISAVSKKGIVLGYEKGSTYRIYMDETKKVDISKDVRFDETAVQDYYQ